MSFFRMIRYGFLILSLSMMTFICVAQETKPGTPLPPYSDVVVSHFEVSTDRAKIGELIQLKLVIEYPDSVRLGEIPTLVMTDVQVLIEHESEPSQRAETRLLTKTWDIVLWRTGLFLTPEMEIPFYIGDQVYFSTAQSASIEIESVLSDPAEAAYPAIPPIDLAETPIYMVLLMLGVILGVVGSVVYTLRRRPASVAIAPQQKGPVASYISELRRLQKQKLSAKERYDGVAAVLGSYLFTEQKLITQEQQTSEEIIDYLENQNRLRDHEFKQLKQIYEQLDLIRFAELSTEVDHIRFINYIIDWVKMMEIRS
ncbi:hypothetical protein MASR2M15_16510 [Anaerolineales bacterium]